MKVDFVNNRQWFFLVSLVVIVVGIAFLFVGGGLRPGIDFAGGSGLTIQLEDSVDSQDLRNSLNLLGHPEATVQNLGENQFFIRTTILQEGERESILQDIETRLSPNGVQQLGFDLVSPVVAQETVINGLWAVLAAAIGIFFYLWWAFRTVPSPFRYGAAALVALVHDVAIVVGIYALLTPILNIEVNTMFLIALLTVIGYSVNDTIVVFDRLRENIHVYPNRSVNEIVNISIAETFSRSINTSLTLLLTLLALFLFGGETIRSFLLVLLIGVVAGTYSSIAIAAQVLVSWENNDIGRIFRRVRSPQAAASTAS